MKNPYRDISTILNWENYIDSAIKTLAFITSTLIILVLPFWYPFYRKYKEKKNNYV